MIFTHAECCRFRLLLAIKTEAALKLTTINEVHAPITSFTSILLTRKGHVNTGQVTHVTCDVSNVQSSNGFATCFRHAFDTLATCFRLAFDCSRTSRKSATGLSTRLSTS